MSSSSKLSGSGSPKQSLSKVGNSNPSVASKSASSSRKTVISSTSKSSNSLTLKAKAVTQSQGVNVVVPTPSVSYSASKLSSKAQSHRQELSTQKSAAKLSPKSTATTRSSREAMKTATKAEMASAQVSSIKAKLDAMDKHNLTPKTETTADSSSLPQMQHQLRSTILDQSGGSRSESPVTETPTPNYGSSGSLSVSRGGALAHTLESAKSPLSGSKGFFIGIPAVVSQSTVIAPAPLPATDSKEKLKNILRADIVEDICSYKPFGSASAVGSGEVSCPQDRMADTGIDTSQLTSSMNSLSVDPTGKLFLKSILKRRHLPIDIQGASSVDGSLQEITTKPFHLVRSVSHSTGIGDRQRVETDGTMLQGGLRKSHSFHGGDGDALSSGSTIDSDEERASDCDSRNGSGEKFPKTLKLLKPKGDLDFEEEEQEVISVDKTRHRIVRSMGSLSKINFRTTVEVLPTFKKTEYNRKPDANVTFRQLTPQLKVQIREELNSFKKREMQVHENSFKNTCFH